jgi:hypothetical protein
MPTGMLVDIVRPLGLVVFAVRAAVIAAGERLSRRRGEGSRALDFARRISLSARGQRRSVYSCS